MGTGHPHRTPQLVGGEVRQADELAAAPGQHNAPAGENRHAAGFDPLADLVK